MDNRPQRQPARELHLRTAIEHFSPLILRTRVYRRGGLIKELSPGPELARLVPLNRRVTHLHSYHDFRCVLHVILVFHERERFPLPRVKVVRVRADRNQHRVDFCCICCGNLCVHIYHLLIPMAMDRNIQVWRAVGYRYVISHTTSDVSKMTLHRLLSCGHHRMQLESDVTGTYKHRWVCVTGAYSNRYHFFLVRSAAASRSVVWFQFLCKQVR
ncbi:hypothetical protein CERSUDRAFT_118663 [Gelatoporia subvermispora B]|uniref:Uncharacterized protein n=1 Tax=Ceriporiopsis subvermispora (strain B) TaxID=914234 RepID=M2R306_CERS8|nr:hypothetical protein CERSUDRAFT_118663 [Gelatoporia subvermispora B]